MAAALGLGRWRPGSRDRLERAKAREPSASLKTCPFLLNGMAAHHHSHLDNLIKDSVNGTTTGLAGSAFRSNA